MSASKQVLIVDDYFEVLSFLKSLLELSDSNVQVTGVPSAEEGFLELRQVDYDLLITDLRLPGIDGFDLVRRARRLRPDIEIIVMTAYYSPEVKQAAADLSVRFLRKPLDTDLILAVAREALGLAATPLQVAAPSGSEALLGLLRDLCRQAGADEAALFRLDGAQVQATGRNWQETVAQIQPALADSLRRSLSLALDLGGGHSSVRQTLENGSQQLFVANLGDAHGLALLYAAGARKAAPAGLWGAIRREVEALTAVVAAIGHTTMSEPHTDPSTVSSMASTDNDQAPERSLDSVPESAETDLHPSPTAATYDSDESDPMPSSTADYPLPVESQTPADLSWLPLAAEDAVDLDAYWAEATEEEDFDAPGSGLSWEEAMAQGLISTDPPVLD